ncbi:MAG: NADH-quinone oxidoreductase subunit D [Candidatus Omnitrophota bacterium]
MKQTLDLKNTDNASLLEINFGPQHPSTHGVFRMTVQLEGEKICGLKPVFGYLHRNHEQIAENLPYAAILPYTDRLDYVNALANNFGYVLAVEKLAAIEVPERAEYLRIIMAELARIVNHITVIGFMLNDLGAFFTPLLYAFRERERILDLFESITGSRLMNNYFRFGGVKRDLANEDLAAIRKIVAKFPAFLKEFEDLLTKNEILCMRCQNVGILSGETATNAGITGPVLRASGVNYDIRKVDGYSLYKLFDFKIPLGQKGDVYDRFYVRVLEIRESLKILDQALTKIPQGEIVNKKAAPTLKNPRSFKPPVGEAYARVESPKGELGFYLVSDGTPQPWRYHVRAPSLINLTVLEEMCLGQKIADAIIILGSIDIVLGETDR